MAAKKKGGRGGKREGAGRPARSADGAVTGNFVVRLSDHERMRLLALSIDLGVSEADAARLAFDALANERGIPSYADNLRHWLEARQAPNGDSE
jgi:hypothetical protein